VHNFEQPLLLWAVIVGLWDGPKLAAGRAMPQNGLEIAGRAENFRPMHISTCDPSGIVLSVMGLHAVSVCT